MENQEIKISNDLTVIAVEHPLHVFLMPGKEVAKGYGVTVENIRKHKSDNSKEFEESKHWVVRITHTPGGKQETILWTLRGVMRLGFMIKSESAKLFRDWAEETLFNTVTGGIQFRGQIISGRVNNQRKLAALEKKLVDNNDYMEIQRLKSLIKKSAGDLRIMDKKIANKQLSMFDEQTDE